jgi:hypothetical protein
VAVVNEDYPGTQLSRDDFVNIQKAIGRLVDELPEEESPPGWSIHTGLRERPSWYARMTKPRTG